MSLIINPLDEFVKRYPQYREGFLETARNNAGYLKELIDELLSFRKMDAGGERMQYTRGNIVTVAKDVFVSFQNIADKRRIDYDFLAPDACVEMAFDRDKMTKVLRNLISNAFKFTPDSGSITVELRRDGPALLIKVSDTGPGVAAGERENVFKMFFQYESNARGGSGIVHYTTADGLSSNQINAVYRDSKGILWVGTSAGLDRYDAYRFNTYSEEDGLPGLYVTRLSEDTQGQIWLYTTQGVACYSYEQDRFLSPEEGLRPMGIRASAPSLFGGSPDHSYFWVAEDRVLSVYSAAQKRVMTFSPRSRRSRKWWSASPDRGYPGR